MENKRPRREADRLRDEALTRALNTPPQPRKAKPAKRTLETPLKPRTKPKKNRTPDK